MGWGATRGRRFHNATQTRSSLIETVHVLRTLPRPLLMLPRGGGLGSQIRLGQGCATCNATYVARDSFFLKRARRLFLSLFPHCGDTPALNEEWGRDKDAVRGWLARSLGMSRLEWGPAGRVLMSSEVLSLVRRPISGGTMSYIDSGEWDTIGLFRYVRSQGTAQTSGLAELWPNRWHSSGYERVRKPEGWTDGATGVCRREGGVTIASHWTEARREKRGPRGKQPGGPGSAPAIDIGKEGAERARLKGLPRRAWVA